MRKSRTRSRPRPTIERLCAMNLNFFSLVSPCVSDLGHVSRKSRKLFGPEKPFVKLLLAYSVKLVFCFKGNKNKNNFKVSCLETPLF